MVGRIVRGRRRNNTFEMDHCGVLPAVQVTGGRRSSFILSGMVAAIITMCLIPVPFPTALAGANQVHPRSVLLSTSNAITPPEDLKVLLMKAVGITTLPSATNPQIVDAATEDWGQPMAVSAGCEGYYPWTSSPIKPCTFGDVTSKKSVVLFGDSHATMWLPALNLLGQKLHFRVINLWKGNCPSYTLTFTPWLAQDDRAYPECNSYVKWAIGEINKMDPEMVILSNSDGDGDKVTGNQESLTPAVWQAGIESTLSKIDSADTEKVVLGDVAYLRNDSGGGTNCLAVHEGSVQQCSEPVSVASASHYAGADQAAASEGGAKYINVIPWMCSTECTAIVGRTLVYADASHLTGPMTELMDGDLELALSLSPS
jgi:hypothetical protein